MGSVRMVGIEPVKKFGGVFLSDVGPCVVVSTEIWERIERVVEMATEPVFPGSVEARSVQKLIAPIDPDILAAREWLKSQDGFGHITIHEEIDRGRHDVGPRIEGFVAGRKSGRSDISE